MNRTAANLLVVSMLFVVLSGCTGVPGAEQPGTQTVAEPESTATTITTSVNRNVSLDVGLARNQTYAEQTDRVVKASFQNLSERKQREFLRALDTDGDLYGPTAWKLDNGSQPSLVKYNDSWYYVNVGSDAGTLTRESGSSTTYLYVTRVENESRVDAVDDALAVTFENLSARWRPEFQEAVENGGRLTNPVAWGQNEPGQPVYVYYKGMWYEVWVART